MLPVCGPLDGPLEGGRRLASLLRTRRSSPRLLAFLSYSTLKSHGSRPHVHCETCQVASSEQPVPFGYRGVYAVVSFFSFRAGSSSPGPFACLLQSLLPRGWPVFCSSPPAPDVPVRGRRSTSPGCSSPGGRRLAASLRPARSSPVLRTTLFHGWSSLSDGWPIFFDPPVMRRPAVTRPWLACH